MAYLLGHFTLMSAGSLHTVVVMPLLAVTTISMAYTAPQLSQWLLRGNDISYGVYIYHAGLERTRGDGVPGKWFYMLPVVGMTFLAGHCRGATWSARSFAVTANHPRGGERKFLNPFALERRYRGVVRLIAFVVRLRTHPRDKMSRFPHRL